MACLAKTKLLCALAFSLITLSAIASSINAQENTEDMEFAPGATGFINAPITELVIGAERAAEELGERLNILGAMEGVEIEDLSGIRERALNDPRVRRLLGVNDEDANTTEEIRYDGAHLWLLLSFSMPKQSLQQAMLEAEKYGVPVVFRGFVNNSVYDTRAAILDVWETEEAAKAFGIDPTLFTRFNVSAVPVVIATSDTLEICETQGCEDDPIPLHDRVAGNIPLDTVLRMIALGGGVGSVEAKRMIEAADEL